MEGFLFPETEHNCGRHSSLPTDSEGLFSSMGLELVYRPAHNNPHSLANVVDFW